MVCVGIDKKKKINKNYKCLACREKEAMARAAGLLVEEDKKKVRRVYGITWRHCVWIYPCYVGVCLFLRNRYLFV